MDVADLRVRHLGGAALAHQHDVQQLLQLCGFLLPQIPGLRVPALLLPHHGQHIVLICQFRRVIRLFLRAGGVVDQVLRALLPLGKCRVKRPFELGFVGLGGVKGQPQQLKIILSIQGEFLLRGRLRLLVSRPPRGNRRLTAGAAPSPRFSSADLLGDLAEALCQFTLLDQHRLNITGADLP